MTRRSVQKIRNSPRDSPPAGKKKNTGCWYSMKKKQLQELQQDEFKGFSGVQAHGAAGGHNPLGGGRGNKDGGGHILSIKEGDAAATECNGNENQGDPGKKQVGDRNLQKPGPIR